MKKVALLINKDMGNRVLGEENRKLLTGFAQVAEIGSLPDRVSPEYIKTALAGADACITCWGTPVLEKDMLEGADSLKLIAHMAGTPRAIVSDYVWEKGIRVVTAAGIIAQDVAETVIGLMIASLKNWWQLSAFTKNGGWGQTPFSDKMLRLRGLTVGIIAASKVGREVIKLLHCFKTNILLYDPMITEEQAKELGCQKAELPYLMANSDVVSVHAPSIPATKHMINKENLSLMKEGALFINTSRGSLINEPDLIEFLLKGKNFACLDVTDPEPPAADNLLRKLENCILLPHVAGGGTINNRLMQGNFIVNQIKSFFENGVLKDEFTKEMFTYIA